MIRDKLMLTACGMMLAAAATCNAAPKGTAKIDTQAVKAYFTASLEGSKAEYGSRTALPLRKTDEFRALVWQAWAEANADFDEDKLPALTPLAGDPMEKPASGVWKLGNDDMQFYYGSKGEQPEGGYPLFLCLHGSGDNEREFHVNLAWAQRYDDSPSVYFIPRSPQGGTGCRWYQPTRQQTWERMLRQAYLTGYVDPDKVYFFGISEGAYGSQRLASFYADYLAGAGPIAGGEQMFWAPPENLASIAFCLQTGAEDTMYGRTIFTQRVNRQLDSLQAAHPGYYEHKVDLQPGRGHGCDYTVTTPYLRQHTRNPHPKYVCWENLPQGNINGEGAAFRDGFYNIYIKERSTDDSDPFVRSHYEMTIEDNRVDLNVNVVTVKAADFVKSDEGWAMNVGETKSYEPATSGRIVIYLNDKLVDMSKPVTVTVNGKEKFRGRLKPDIKDMVESCARYFDPERVFPASVEVTVE